MTDDPRPGRMPDDERAEESPAGRAGRQASRGEEGGGRSPEQAASRLVWPPTEDELDAWEVVPLGHDATDVPPPAPAAGPPGVEPPPVAPAPSTPAEKPPRPTGGTVVVRAAPPGLLGQGPEFRHGTAPVPTRDRLVFSDRLRRRHLAASTLALIVTVPLLAILSAAAGFAAAVWIGPTLVPGTAAPPPTVLVVESREPGAQVLVNGEPWGTTPLRLSMTGGETRIEVDSRTSGDESAVVAGSQRISPTAGVTRGPGADAPGSLLIRSTPPGARVVFGGRFRGVTPLSVGGIPPGRHDVEIAGARGATLRRVVVQAGELSVVDVDLAAGPADPSPATAPPDAQTGYVSVRSTVPLQVRLEGRPVGTSAVPRIPLAPGTHDVQFISEALEFVTSRTVDVRSGATIALTIEVPNGRASFDAQPSAQVWLQGRLLGETPLADVELPIGVHEVEFRHPDLGTRRETVVVRVRTPARVSVRFSP